MDEKKEDLVNHPSHYTKGIECLEYCESWDMDIRDFNVVKYVTRYRFKNPGDLSKQIQDLKKAEFYLKRQIRKLENQKDMIFDNNVTITLNGVPLASMPPIRIT